MFLPFRRIWLFGSSGNDGRNGMLVDQLRYFTADRNNVVVEERDVAMQPDATYQVNRYRRLVVMQFL